MRMTNSAIRSLPLSKKGRKNYGTRRIKSALAKEEITVSRRRIGRLMREEDLLVQTKRKFKVTTDSNHDKPIATEPS